MNTSYTSTVMNETEVMSILDKLEELVLCLRSEGKGQSQRCIDADKARHRIMRAIGMGEFDRPYKMAMEVCRDLHI